jgi:hypothetical protein
MEMIMKRSTIAKTFAIAAITVLALGVAPTAKADNKGCSNATLTGTFAFTSSGVITSPPARSGPFAEVGTQTFDGAGNTTATAMAANGTIIPLTITGTYTVNQDCTGTMSLFVIPFNATVPVYFVIADNGNEFHGIETAAGYVITRIARKLYPGRAI